MSATSSLRSRVLRRVAIWVVILATLSLIPWLVYQRLTYELPIGSGPAGPVVAAGHFRKTWSTRPVVLLALGDSVTAGFGSTRGRSYVELLSKQPADDDPALAGCTLSAVFPTLKVVRKAVSGSTSFALAGQMPRMPYSAETLGVVVMTSGGNDLLHDYGRSPPVENAMYGATWEQTQPWFVGYAARLEAAVVRLGEVFPGGFHLFLATIYDPTDGIGDIESAGLPAWPDGLRILAAYNDLIAACAAKHPQVHLVDQRALFLGHGIHCTETDHPHHHADDPHYWYFRNLEDPNNRGYDALRRLFLNEMAAVLAPRR